MNAEAHVSRIRKHERRQPSDLARVDETLPCRGMIRPLFSAMISQPHCRAAAADERQVEHFTTDEEKRRLTKL